MGVTSKAEVAPLSFPYEERRFSVFQAHPPCPGTRAKQSMCSFFREEGVLLCAKDRLLLRH